MQWLVVDCCVRSVRLWAVIVCGRRVDRCAARVSRADVRAPCVLLQGAPSARHRGARALVQDAQEAPGLGGGVSEDVPRDGRAAALGEGLDDRPRADEALPAPLPGGDQVSRRCAARVIHGRRTAA